ncbi:PqqD family peptide modification chaperone [Candidatus Sumerlaeota bacterium]|nr:PqqD family peptide modification chaperone [Candidatus Sumerlaeota bacterium]
MKGTRNTAKQKADFLALRDGVYLVKGPVGAVLYDLRHRKIWIAPPLLVGVLERCGEGETLDRALPQAMGKSLNPQALRMIRRFLRRHPAVKLAGTARPLPPEMPVRRTVRPTWLMVEILTACDLRCSHCYTPAFHAPDGRVSRTLPTSRWIELLEEAREFGFQSVQITGGEPTLHPDIAQLLRAAHRLGYLPVAFFTNLFRLSDDLLAVLCEIGAQVHTSLYSHDAKIHDSITRQVGSFDATLEGIRRVQAAKLEILVAVVRMEANDATYDQTRAFLKDLGVAMDHQKSGPVWPEGRGVSHAKPDPSWPWPRRFFTWMQHVTKGQLVTNSCWAGRSAIAPNGDVYACVGERKALGNVASASLRSVVESEAMQKLWRINLDDVPGCSQCEFRYACFDCRAGAHLLSGDILGRDPTCAYDPATGIWNYEVSAMDNKKPKRKEGLVIEEVDSDLIVADFSGLQMHVLNPVAAAIWEMCDGQQTAEDMASLLAGHFGLSVEEVRRDVDRTLSEFAAKGMIE